MNVAYKQPMGGAQKPYKLTGKVPSLKDKKPANKKK